MGENFYEVWLYARRAAARVRMMHGGARAVVLPEIFSGQAVRLESLRAPRNAPRNNSKKHVAPVLSFHKKQDERGLRHHAQAPSNHKPSFDKGIRTRNLRKKGR